MARTVLLRASRESHPRSGFQVVKETGWYAPVMEGGRKMGRSHQRFAQDQHIALPQWASGLIVVGLLSSSCSGGSGPSDPEGATFALISAGMSHTCGLTSGGVPYCWGRNGSGELGNGSTTSSLVPVGVAGRLALAGISSGRDGLSVSPFAHTCGWTAQGAAYCWGDNRTGELGDATEISSAVPVAVLDGLKFVS